ncbi:MAG: ATP-binding protein [Ferruginibacter sp.]
MDTTETSIYHVAIVARTITIVFVLLFLGFSLWLQRKFNRRHQRRLQVEMMVLEKERARIAADLHDDIAPILFSAKTRLELLKITGSESIADRNKALVQLADAEAKLRNLSKGLLPISLQKEGLEYAVKEYLFNLMLSDDLKISFTTSDIPHLDDNSLIHVFRILQEVVQNTIKHSKATLLHIEMTGKENILSIATADNGTGFNSSQLTARSKGYGLYNIRSRANYLKADLNLSSKPGKGCKYKIVINCLKTMKK